MQRIQRMCRQWMMMVVVVVCTAAMLRAQAPDVTLTGTLQGANGLPAANTVLNFVPTQTFFIPGVNTTQQVGNIYANTAPSGSCAVSGQFYTYFTPPSAPVIYQCIYGVWVTSQLSYPASGIVSSTGSGWGTSYGTTGSGSVVLANGPTFTALNCNIGIPFFVLGNGGGCAQPYYQTVSGYSSGSAASYNQNTLAFDGTAFNLFNSTLLHNTTVQLNYPASGIVSSTGSGWGTSYGTTGSGSVVLANAPTFTALNCNIGIPYFVLGNGGCAQPYYQTVSGYSSGSAASYNQNTLAFDGTAFNLFNSTLLHNTTVQLNYPASGIVSSTGSGWGTSYGTTGSGSVVLANGPTFTALNCNIGIPFFVLGNGGGCAQPYYQTVSGYSSGSAASYNQNTLAFDTTAFNLTNSTSLNKTTVQLNLVGAQFGGTGVNGTLSGIPYANNSSPYTVATSSQIQAAIGSSAYDPYGSAAARAAASNCTSGQYATGTGTSSTPCSQVQYSQIGGTAPSITTNNNVTCQVGGSLCAIQTVHPIQFADMSKNLYTGSQVLLNFVSAVSGYVFPNNLVLNQYGFNCAPQAQFAMANTNTYTITLEKNRIPFGTLTINEDNGSVSAATSTTTFNQGDVLTLVAPSTPDVTAEGLYASLCAWY